MIYKKDQPLKELAIPAGINVALRWYDFFFFFFILVLSLASVIIY